MKNLRSMWISMMTLTMIAGFALAGCAQPGPGDEDPDESVAQQGGEDEQVGEAQEALSAKCRNTCSTMEKHCKLGCGGIAECTSDCADGGTECWAWCDAEYPGWP